MNYWYPVIGTWISVIIFSLEGNFWATAWAYITFMWVRDHYRISQEQHRRREL